MLFRFFSSLVSFLHSTLFRPDDMTYNPLDPAVTANPYPHYARLRSDDPVKWLETMQGFAVSRWDDVEEVLSDDQTFSSAQFWPALLGEYDRSEEHTSELQSLMRSSYAVIRLKNEQHQ